VEWIGLLVDAVRLRRKSSLEGLTSLTVGSFSFAEWDLSCVEWIGLLVGAVRLRRKPSLEGLTSLTVGLQFCCVEFDLYGMDWFVSGCSLFMKEVKP
jgi:hypothetical protein